MYNQQPQQPQRQPLSRSMQQMQAQRMQQQQLPQQPMVNRFGTTQDVSSDLNGKTQLGAMNPIQDRSSRALGLDDMQPQRPGMLDNFRDQVRRKMLLS